MKTSEFLLSTQKETPSDAEIVSHQYMLRAGMIRKLSAGIYSWLPLGLRVLKKVEKIVREEMDKSGGLEILMPNVNPAELWIETNRWDKFGPQLLKIKDRHDRDYCFGPTHEEVITDIARHELKSYRQLPIMFYQIQTKFRDEIRPRFGVMRSREFLMKDGYSFHLSDESLQKTYDLMYETYTRIFSRMGLKFRAVIADTGSMGGSISQEFQVLADSGEDAIAYCDSDDSDYAANMEMATSLPPKGKHKDPTGAMQKVDTPNQKTIDEVSAFLKTSQKQTVKTLIVKGIESPLIALVLRGDHQLNEVKASKLPQVASPLTFATDEEILQTIGVKTGSIGPVNLTIPTIVDYSAAHLSDFVCGANENDKHYINVNWGRDAHAEIIADIRNVVEGDLSPDGKGILKIVRGIEVGQIFQLGKKYTESMNATVLDENGKTISMTMGCYGIGVSRTVAAAIEQNHDDRGIIWPEPIAPFQIAIVPIGYERSALVKSEADAIYNALQKEGYEVLFDDRNERPGVMFADMDLIGIPHRIVIGEKGLANGMIEYKGRRDTESQQIPEQTIMDFLKALYQKYAPRGY
jgi:prolyl-tRNA synthetase